MVESEVAIRGVNGDPASICRSRTPCAKRALVDQDSRCRKLPMRLLIQRMSCLRFCEWPEMIGEMPSMVMDSVAEISICPPCDTFVDPFIWAASLRRNSPVVMKMFAGDWLLMLGN